MTLINEDCVCGWVLDTHCDEMLLYVTAKITYLYFMFFFINYNSYLG